jgi:hypothetical protein
MSKILLVAREEHLHEAIPQLLNSDSFEFQHSYGLGDVFERLSAHKYLLIVCEYRLGSMTGLDLLKILQISHPDTRLLLLLDKADEKVKDKARQAGTTLCMVRPFPLEEVGQEILKLSSASGTDTMQREIQRYDQQSKPSPTSKPNQQEAKAAQVLKEMDSFKDFTTDLDSAGTSAQPQAPEPEQRWGVGEPSLKFEVSDDGQFAFMSCVPNLKAPFTVEIVKEKLTRMGVIYGIDNEKVDRLLKDAHGKMKIIQREVIARGTSPVDGVPQRVKLKVPSHSLPTNFESGSPWVIFDSKEVTEFACKGEQVGELLPPEPPRHGRLVTGENCPGKPAMPFEPEAGKNCTYDESVPGFLSQIDQGQVLLKKEKILEVHKVLLLGPTGEENTGDVDFDGTVIITESVGGSRTIKAEGDVIIHGMIDGTNINCEGSLYVRGGIQGGNKGVIRSGGNIVAKFCANSEVESSGNMVFEKSILNSRIFCEGLLKVKGTKGIVGGRVIAGSGIDTLSVGSSLGISTDIFLGKYAEAQEELIGLLPKKNSNFENVRKVAVAIKSLRTVDPSQLSRDQAQKLNKLAILLRTLRERDREYTDRMVEINKQLTEKTTANLVVRDCLYPDVNIRIGRTVLTDILDPIKRSVFKQHSKGMSVEISPLMGYGEESSPDSDLL